MAEAEAAFVPLWQRHEFPRRDVQARGLVIAMSIANARLQHWADHFEEIEPEILDWIDGFERGCVFYDLGASIGLFSLYAALRAEAEVVAFEPEAQNFATLELNHYLNRSALRNPLHSLNVAVANHTGLERLHCRFYGAGEHVKIVGHPATRDGAEGFAPAHTQTVITMPLDDLIRTFSLPAPNHLKIDVDGSELDVLQGAEATLRAPALKSVFIELTDTDGSLASACARLGQFGFRKDRVEPVVRLAGGVYPGLFNLIFTRP